MGNAYKPTYDVFAVHEHNSMMHHLAVIVAWYMVSWPLLFIAYIGWSLLVGAEFQRRPFRIQMMDAAHISMLVHHLIASFFGLRTAWRCGVTPLLTGEDSCFGVYRPEYSLSLMVTVGYFLHDLTIYLFLSKDFSALGMQSIYHHIAGTISFLLGVYVGADLPLVFQVVTGTELTNIFLIIRDRIGKEKEGKTVFATVNVLMFVLSYTILRMVMCPALGGQMLYNLYDGFANQSPPLTWKIGYTICSILCGGVMGLNIYWYSFILKGLKRLLTGEERPKRTEQSKKIE